MIRLFCFFIDPSRIWSISSFIYIYISRWSYQLSMHRFRNEPFQFHFRSSIISFLLQREKERGFLFLLKCWKSLVNHVSILLSAILVRSVSAFTVSSDASRSTFLVKRPAFSCFLYRLGKPSATARQRRSKKDFQNWIASTLRAGSAKTSAGCSLLLDIALSEVDDGFWLRYCESRRTAPFCDHRALSVPVKTWCCYSPAIKMRSWNPIPQKFFPCTSTATTLRREMRSSLSFPSSNKFGLFFLIIGQKEIEGKIFLSIFEYFCGKCQVLYFFSPKNSRPSSSLPMWYGQRRSSFHELWLQAQLFAL